MKNIKILTLSASLLLALTTITSCNGGSTYEEQYLPSDDPTTTKTIEFWHCLGKDKTANLEKIVSQFNQTYAGKYEVKLSKIAGDYDALHDAVKTKLAANEIPALTMGYPDSFAEYMTNDINDSAIIKLDNFINDATHGYSTAEIEDFVDQFYAEGSAYQLQGTWSLPMYKSTEIMYYNASYFAGDNEQNYKKFANDSTFLSLANAVVTAAAGVTDAQLEALKTYVDGHSGYTYEVPVTWNDMITVGRKINADRAAQGITGQFYPVGYDSDANMLISQFAQRGIPYTVNSEEATQDPSKHFVFNTPEARAFVTETVGLINENVLITKGSLGGSKYTNEFFTARQCAMAIGSTGGSSYQVSSNFRVSLAPVPYHGTTPKYIMQGPSVCFFNNSDPYIHKGAWLFYKAMSEPVANARLALENSYDPVRDSSYETTDYANWIARHEADLKYDIPYHTKDLRSYYITSPVFVGSSTARTQIGLIIQSITNSGYSVEEAFLGAYNTCVRSV